jgi:MFS family permease
MDRITSPTVRHLAVAQALYVGSATVDLTVTGIVGQRMAPTPQLATVPFSIIFLAAGLSTFGISRAIGRFGHRATFTTFAAAAAASGCVSAVAVHSGDFWLFCIGTALIGVYAAGSGYYGYLAAESMPTARARAVATVLAGGLAAALVGPFLATGLRNVTATPYVGSYALVAVLGVAAAAWNFRLVAPPKAAIAATTSVPAERGRGFIALWRQPTLIRGVGAMTLAAWTMMAMMTAGPIVNHHVGHTEVQSALAIQLHLIGMYAPGFLVARAIGRLGERLIALLGAVLIVLAGLAAAVGTSLPLYLTAMFIVGVGWNLACSGGTALVASSYRHLERGRVQPVAESLNISAGVMGSLVAAAFASPAGWRWLGLICAALAAVTGAALAARRAPRPRSRSSHPSLEPSHRGAP